MKSRVSKAFSWVQHCSISFRTSTTWQPPLQGMQLFSAAGSQWQPLPHWGNGERWPKHPSAFKHLQRRSFVHKTEEMASAKGTANAFSSAFTRAASELQPPQALRIPHVRRAAQHGAQWNDPYTWMQPAQRSGPFLRFNKAMHEDGDKKINGEGKSEEKEKDASGDEAENRVWRHLSQEQAYLRAFVARSGIADLARTIEEELEALRELDAKNEAEAPGEVWGPWCYYIDRTDGVALRRHRVDKDAAGAAFCKQEKVRTSGVLGEDSDPDSLAATNAVDDGNKPANVDPWKGNAVHLNQMESAMEDELVLDLEHEVQGRLGQCKASRDQRYLAFMAEAEDGASGEKHTLFIKDLRSGELLPHCTTRGVVGFEWLADSTTFVYTLLSAPSPNDDSNAPLTDGTEGGGEQSVGEDRAMELLFPTQLRMSSVKFGPRHKSVLLLDLHSKGVDTESGLGVGPSGLGVGPSGLGVEPGGLAVGPNGRGVGSGASWTSPYFLEVSRSKDWQYITVNLNSHTSSQVYVLDAPVAQKLLLEAGTENLVPAWSTWSFREQAWNLPEAGREGLAAGTTASEVEEHVMPTVAEEGSLEARQRRGDGGLGQNREVTEALRLVEERQDGVEYYIEHCRGHFLALTNWAPPQDPGHVVVGPTAERERGSAEGAGTVRGQRQDPRGAKGPNGRWRGAGTRGGLGGEVAAGEYRVLRRTAGAKAQGWHVWEEALPGLAEALSGEPDGSAAPLVIADIEVFRSHCVLFCRDTTLGRPHVLIYDLDEPDGGASSTEIARKRDGRDWESTLGFTAGEQTMGRVKRVQIPSYVTDVATGANEDSASPTLRLILSSPLHPPEHADVDLATGEVVALAWHEHDGVGALAHKKEERGEQQGPGPSLYSLWNQLKAHLTGTEPGDPWGSTEIKEDQAGMDLAARFECFTVLAPSQDGAQVPLTIVGRKGIQSAITAFYTANSSVESERAGRHTACPSSSSAVGAGAGAGALGAAGASASGESANRADASWERAPVLLEGYGAYGRPLPLAWSRDRLALLERGWVLAFAHVRGGGELGKAWHRAGRRDKKLHSILDFIACAEYLKGIQGVVCPRRIAAKGTSAGGLLVAAAANLRPGLFRALVLDVPFLDALGSMMDPSLPLTAQERDEWGDPASDVAAFRSIQSFCPYSNIPTLTSPCASEGTQSPATRLEHLNGHERVWELGSGANPSAIQAGARNANLETEANDEDLYSAVNRRVQSFPAVLVTAALGDCRVGFWEASKWAARVRERCGREGAEERLVVARGGCTVSNAGPILLNCRPGGHFADPHCTIGAGLAVSQTALEYAFLIQATT